MRARVGWVAVALSTLLSSAWAFWGSIESFHEGWYYRELWRNVALMCVQYLPWMLLPMVAALIALRSSGAGLVAHGMLGAGAFALFGVLSIGAYLIAIPLVVLGLLHWFGRAAPRRRAVRTLVYVPLITAVIAGAYPAWRVFTRPRDVQRGPVHLWENGVNLVWAPAGPGWDRVGMSWDDARRRCAHLRADGVTISSSPVNVWRLPEVDEAVRAQRWRGVQASGVWRPDLARAVYAHQPDKEPPLWDPFSPVIYWWTATEAGEGRAYRIAYNGHVRALPTSAGIGSLGCRCVREPDAGD